MSLGFLGALGGLGQGMSQAGTAWADELKQQRILDAKEKLMLDSESREQGRYDARKADEREFQETRDAANRTHELERDTAKYAHEKELDKNKPGGASGTKQTNVLAIRKLYNEERKAHEEAQKYEDVKTPFPDMGSWMSSVGLGGGGVPGSASAAGGGSTSKPVDTSNWVDDPNKMSVGARDVFRAYRAGATIEEIRAHGLSKGLTEYDVDVWLKEAGITP